jgi:hypothetical protein
MSQISIFDTHKKEMPCHTTSQDHYISLPHHSAHLPLATGPPFPSRSLIRLSTSSSSTSSPSPLSLQVELSLPHPSNSSLNLWVRSSVVSRACGGYVEFGVSNVSNGTPDGGFRDAYACDSVSGVERGVAIDFWYL